MRKHLINLLDDIALMSLIATFPMAAAGLWDLMMGVMFFAAAYFAWRSSQEEV